MKSSRSLKDLISWLHHYHKQQASPRQHKYCFLFLAEAKGLWSPFKHFWMICTQSFHFSHRLMCSGAKLRASKSAQTSIQLKESSSFLSAGYCLKFSSSFWPKLRRKLSCCCTKSHHGRKANFMLCLNLHVWLFWHANILWNHWCSFLPNPIPLKRSGVSGHSSMHLFSFSFLLNDHLRDSCSEFCCWMTMLCSLWTCFSEVLYKLSYYYWSYIWWRFFCCSFFRCCFVWSLSLVPPWFWITSGLTWRRAGVMFCNTVSVISSLRGNRSVYSWYCLTKQDIWK